MNNYIRLILDNLDITYICSVMLIGYMFTKSSLLAKIKIQKRWLILAIGLLVAVFYYFVIKINLDKKVTEICNKVDRIKINLAKKGLNGDE